MLDATVHPPIKTRHAHDLLPGTSLGGADIFRHLESVPPIWRVPHTP